MRILHTADWHLGRTLEGRSRLPEQEAFLDELAAMVRDQRIDIVLMAGDVYDSVNPPAAAEALFYDAVARLADGGERQVAVIAGNHDNPERLMAAAPLADERGIMLIGRPEARLRTLNVARTGEQAQLLALPYPSESRLGELLAEEADEETLRAAYSERIGRLVRQLSAGFRRDAVHLLMTHLFVMGGMESESERPIQVGGAYTVNAAALCQGAQYVALGHLHRPQQLRADAPLRYAGSPLAFSFSEAGQAKSVTVIDIGPGRPPVVEELFLTSGKPLVRWKADKGIEQVFRWLDEGKDRNAWIDLEIHLSAALSMEQIQQVRKLHDGIIHIRPVYPEMERADEWRRAEQAPIDELFRSFFRRQTGGGEPEAELVRLFLELLEEESPEIRAVGVGEAMER